MANQTIQLPYLAPGQAFPPAQEAWGKDTAAPGLLASGGILDVATLQSAYSQGIFPWFSLGQPVLWWSPHPRMALAPADFKLHRSLRRVLVRFSRRVDCEIRMDTAFTDVITACAGSPRDNLRRRTRPGQTGPAADPTSTWIVPTMVDAYISLHRAGVAHSVETWINGELAGGLYCVAIGKAVFGESMFCRATDASKIALAALVCFCRHQGITLIDCQQNTGHLASLGAREIARADFLTHLERCTRQASPHWRFDNLYWQALLKPTPVPIAS